MKAGTAELFVDMDKAKAKVREFGTAAKTSNAEVAATIKAMEGNFQGANRAIARFLTSTLGVGPIVAAAFPVVGAVLLGTAVLETGKKIAAFFSDMRNAAEKARAAFRELNAPLKLTNDELAVSNLRLENDIAKLEGKRQNTLQVALAEARVEADKLADSLEKDLRNLEKLLNEQKVGFLQEMFGKAGTGDIKELIGGESGTGGLIGANATLMDEMNTRLEKAGSLKEKDAIRTEIQTRQLRLYQAALDQVEAKLKAGSKISIAGSIANQLLPGGASSLEDDASRREQLQALTTSLRAQMRMITLSGMNSNLQERKNQLQADADNAALGRPFEDRMKAMNAQLEGIEAKMRAAGQGEGARIIASGYGEALKVIEEVNKALEKQHTALSADQKESIIVESLRIAQATAEEQWRTKLAQTTAQIQERTRAQERLVAAIGQGFAAQRAAAIETQLAQAVGMEHYNDPAWMRTHAADVTGLRSGIAREFDAQHAEQGARNLDKLQDEINLQNRLTEAQRLGEEEIRKITAQEIIRQAVERGATGAEIVAEVTKYYGTIRLEQAKRIEGLKAETGYTKQLADAQLQGAEAARQQALENKYAEMQRTGHGGEVAAERAKDEAEHQAQITDKVAARLNIFRNEQEALDQERDRILEIVKETGATLDTERALRDLRNEQIRILRDQQLAIGTARAGIRAFFLEMQTSAKTTGQILYESLTSALDRVSDEMARLLTGQKTNFARMLQGLGEEGARSALRSAMQRGLGAIGARLGIQLPQTTKPTGRPGDPVHVWIENVWNGGTWGNASDLRKPGGSSGSGFLSSIGHFLSAFQGGSGGSGGSSAGSQESVSSSIQYMAGGGQVSPSQAYIVGERGPELLTGASGRILSNSSAQRAFGGGPMLSIGHIDARGGDAAAIEQNVYRAVRMAHDAAVRNAAEANIQRSYRVPQPIR